MKEIEWGLKLGGEIARHPRFLVAKCFFLMPGYLQVEAENLNQKCKQLMQAEARGRIAAEAKLEIFKVRRDREVQLADAVPSSSLNYDQVIFS